MRRRVSDFPGRPCRIRTSVIPSLCVMTMRDSSLFVRAETLLARPSAKRLFIDVRLGDPAEALSQYRDCHIHGAVYAQIRDAFAAPPTPASGNLPLPDLASLAQTLATWGVGTDTEVVVYGPTPALAARGWWVLQWAGLTQVRLLDGGLRAWMAAGGPVARGDAPRRPTQIPLTLPGSRLAQIDAAGVGAVDQTVALIDARDEATYHAGHIRGARSLPAAGLWSPAGVLRSPDAILSQYAEAGIAPGDDVVVYCGGGVLSALTCMTLLEAGMRPHLYVGSWSEWSKDPARRQQSAVGSAA